MHDYVPMNPKGAFDPQPGRACIYQPVGREPRLAKIAHVDRAANLALVTFPDSADPAERHAVRLDHLRKAR